jgi:hypothetical protein
MFWQLPATEDGRPRFFLTPQGCKYLLFFRMFASSEALLRRRHRRDQADGQINLSY